MSNANKAIAAYHVYSALLRRDFLGHYRRSLIGPLWVCAQPLAYLAVFILIRSFFDIPSDDIPFHLFALSGIIPWIFLASSMSRCVKCIASHQDIIKKSAVPRFIFPTVAISLTFLDFIIMTVIFYAVCLASGYDIQVISFSHIFLLSLLVALTVGACLLVAAVGAFRDDIAFALPTVLQLGLFASPIIYPLSIVPEKWQGLYSLNPMVGIIEGLRSATFKGASVPTADLWLTALTATGFVLLAVYVFRRAAQYFADVI